MEQKYEIEKVREYVKKIDEIQRIAMDNLYSSEVKQTEEVRNLLHVIDDLARVAGMFGDTIVQNIKGDMVTADPQKYIEEKLPSAHSRMQKIK